MDVRLVVLVLMSIVSTHTVESSAVGWNYAKDSAHGPEHWKNTYEDCGGSMQSPIDIENKHVLYDIDLKYFNISDYSKTDGVQMSLHNIGGHTAEVKYAGTPVLLHGGSLPAVYQVDQFHFHWGKEDTRGSEHSMDREHFPMEMHIVHHQVNLGNLSTSMSHPFGLAVLGFFFKVGKENSAFAPLLEHFDKISRPGNSTSIVTFKLADLLGNPDKLDYYRYMGSLTTPPCYETVVWSLATEHIEISEAQINKFRDLYDAEFDRLGDDFRPIQPRNERTVTTTVVKDNNGDGANGLHASIVSITISCVLSLALLL